MAKNGARGSEAVPRKVTWSTNNKKREEKRGGGSIKKEFSGGTRLDSAGMAIEGEAACLMRAAQMTGSSFCFSVGGRIAKNKLPRRGPSVGVHEDRGGGLPLYGGE